MPSTTTTIPTDQAAASTGATPPVSMTAAVRRRYGSADAVTVEVVPTPEVGPTDVLIDVVAAGLDRGVCHLMTGTPYLLRLAGFGVFRPKQPVLGMDVAGVVVAVGASVTRFAPGNEVMGIAKGSFAEYSIAEAEKLAIKPTGVSFEQAAVSTISGITALQALTTVGRVEAGHCRLSRGYQGLPGGRSEGTPQGFAPVLRKVDRKSEQPQVFAAGGWNDDRVKQRGLA